MQEDDNVRSALGCNQRSSVSRDTEISRCERLSRTKKLSHSGPPELETQPRKIVNTKSDVKQRRAQPGVALWRRVRARVHRCGVVGLGIAGERSSITDDNLGYYWTEIHAKIFLGPWLVNLHVPISRQRVLPF